MISPLDPHSPPPHTHRQLHLGAVLFITDQQNSISEFLKLQRTLPQEDSGSGSVNAGAFISHRFAFKIKAKIRTRILNDAFESSMSVYGLVMTPSVCLKVKAAVPLLHRLARVIIYDICFCEHHDCIF